MTFTEAARIMMTKTPVIKPLTITSNGEYTAPNGVDGYNPILVNVPESSNSYLEYVSKSKWSKPMVNIPINDIYHYTINIVLFDDASSFQYNLSAGWAYFNALVVTSSTADPPEYDLSTYVSMKKCSKIALVKICWKNGEPIYADYLKDLANYHPSYSYSWYRNTIYSYITDEYIIDWDKVSGGGGGITYKYTELSSEYIKVANPTIRLSYLGFGGPVVHNVYEFDSDMALSSGTTKFKSTEIVSITGTTSLSNFDIELFDLDYGLTVNINQIEYDLKNIYRAIHYNYSGKYTQGVFLESPSSY